MHHLSIVCDCFPATSVELRTWDKDLMVHKILSYLISGPLWGKFADPLIKKKKKFGHAPWHVVPAFPSQGWNPQPLDWKVESRPLDRQGTP